MEIKNNMSPDDRYYIGSIEEENELRKAQDMYDFDMRAEPRYKKAEHMDQTQQTKDVFTHIPNFAHIARIGGYVDALIPTVPDDPMLSEVVGLVTSALQTARLRRMRWFWAHEYNSDCPKQYEIRITISERQDAHKRGGREITAGTLVGLDRNAMDAGIQTLHWFAQRGKTRVYMREERFGEADTTPHHTSHFVFGMRLTKPVWVDSIIDRIPYVPVR